MSGHDFRDPIPFPWEPRDRTEDGELTIEELNQYCLKIEAENARLRALLEQAESAIYELLPLVPLVIGGPGKFFEYSERKNAEKALAHIRKELGK
jgi:mitochondrial fission protein ELM1